MTADCKTGNNNSRSPDQDRRFPTGTRERERELTVSGAWSPEVTSGPHLRPSILSLTITLIITLAITLALYQLLFSPSHPSPHLALLTTMGRGSVAKLPRRFRLCVYCVYRVVCVCVGVGVDPHCPTEILNASNPSAGERKPQKGTATFPKENTLHIGIFYCFCVMQSEKGQPQK